MRLNMFSRHRTLAFILKKEDKGEADKILTVYSEEFGKLKILGRAVRKIKSKLNGGIRRFSLSEIEFIRGKANTLTDSRAARSFGGIRKDLRKLKSAELMADALDSLAVGEEKDGRIWNLFFSSFSELEAADGRHAEAAAHRFLWRLFSALGYGPSFGACVFCRAAPPAEKKFFFVPEEGGTVCPRCFAAARRQSRPFYIEIGASRVKILKAALEGDFSVFSELEIAEADLKALESISGNYLDFIKEQKLN